MFISISFVLSLDFFRIRRKRGSFSHGRVNRIGIGGSNRPALLARAVENQDKTEAEKRPNRQDFQNIATSHAQAPPFVL